MFIQSQIIALNQKFSYLAIDSPAAEGRHKSLVSKESADCDNCQDLSLKLLVFLVFVTLYDYFMIRYFMLKI